MNMATQASTVAAAAAVRNGSDHPYLKTVRTEPNRNGRHEVIPCWNYMISLNIKSALATELANRMNTSLTEAVTVALQNKLAATETEAIVERRRTRLRTMADESAVRLTPEQRAMNIDDELYDEYGLPK